MSDYADVESLKETARVKGEECIGKTFLDFLWEKGIYTRISVFVLLITIIQAVMLFLFLDDAYTERMLNWVPILCLLVISGAFMARFVGFDYQEYKKMLCRSLEDIYRAYSDDQSHISVSLKGEVFKIEIRSLKHGKTMTTFLNINYDVDAKVQLMKDLPKKSENYFSS